MAQEVNFDNLKTNVVISCTYFEDMVGIRVHFNGKNKAIAYDADIVTFFEELIELLTSLSISSFTLNVIAKKDTFTYSTTRNYIINSINSSKDKNKTSIKNLENLMSNNK